MTNLFVQPIGAPCRRRTHTYLAVPALTGRPIWLEQGEPANAP